MPEKHTARRFSEYNRILKENDELYRSAVKTMGLPDCAFWILYTLRESSETLTQSDVCYTLYQPKQTVNSALKKLADGGYIVLSEQKDRRSKPLSLTEKGQRLAEKRWTGLSPPSTALWQDCRKKSRIFLSGCSRQYTDLLRDSLGGSERAVTAPCGKQPAGGNARQHPPV